MYKTCEYYVYIEYENGGFHRSNCLCKAQEGKKYCKRHEKVVEKEKRKQAERGEW